MLESRTISISIQQNWRHVYESLWRPEAFTQWASGLSNGDLVKDSADWWITDGPGGQIRIRFTPHNEFGVMDHQIDLGEGEYVFVPMRIVPNEDGTEILFTLFRQPDMTDEKFEADMRWVARDMVALKSLLQSQNQNQQNYA